MKGRTFETAAVLGAFCGLIGVAFVIVAKSLPWADSTSRAMTFATGLAALFGGAIVIVTCFLIACFDREE